MREDLVLGHISPISKHPLQVTIAQSLIAFVSLELLAYPLFHILRFLWCNHNQIKFICCKKKLCFRTEYFVSMFKVVV